MTTENTKYTGKVIDRITGETVYASKPKATWGEAQAAADKHAKGDRYKVVVE